MSGGPFTTSITITIAAATIFVPPVPAGPILPMDQRDFQFESWDPETDWFSLLTMPGDILRRESSEDLHTFTPEWLIPCGAIQAADGTIAGTGQTLWAASEKPRKKGPIRKYRCWVRKRNT